MRALIHFVAACFTAYLLAVVALSFIYQFIPPATPLMVVSALRGDGMKREWVPLSRIAPSVLRSVIVSEDARFCEHDGIDWKAVDRVVQKAARQGKATAGASTITMQVTKNLFLFNTRSFLRKAVEAPLALWLDAVMPKRRILEIYLNMAEWGEGRFGIEAAARHEFGVGAGQLSAQQAALLVTMLPAPKDRSAANPGPKHAAMAATVAARAPRANTSCLR